MNLIDAISINKYYKMDDAQLESEASKWKIKNYRDARGNIQRQIIIDALLKKDSANNSRYAIIISLIAVLISIINFLLK